MERNGWRLYLYRLFAAQLDELKTEVAALQRADPVGYRSHPKSQLLASLYKAILETVPSNPNHPDFRLGRTLGPAYSHWRRVKKGMPGRYRLFFRFASKPAQLVVYAWLNDEDTLRKAGAKTDVYSVFARLLARGEVPSGIDELLRQSRAEF